MSDDNNNNNKMDDGSSSSSSSNRLDIHVEQHHMGGTERSNRDGYGFGHMMRDPVGVLYFQRYLAKEFATESILFLNDYAKLKQAKTQSEQDDIAHHIYTSFIVRDAPNELNLSASVRSKITKHFENASPALLHHKSKSSPSSPSAISAVVSHTDRFQFGTSNKILPTDPKNVIITNPTRANATLGQPSIQRPKSLFVLGPAQAQMLDLLWQDSFPRFQKSTEYQDWINNLRTHS